MYNSDVLLFQKLKRIKTYYLIKQKVGNGTPPHSSKEVSDYTIYRIMVVLFIHF